MPIDTSLTDYRAVATSAQTGGPTPATQLVLAFFESEAAADGAAGALRGWARRSTRVQLAAVGVLVKDAAGAVKTHKLGATEAEDGLGIGAVLGAAAGDVERIGLRLDAGEAAVACLVPPSQAAAILEELEALGGEAEAVA
jgi:hypothetical protein